MKPLLTLTLAGCAMTASIQSSDAPPEFGRVSWHRDHDAAFELAKEAKKPVFLLFQEVPG